MFFHRKKNEWGDGKKIHESALLFLHRNNISMVCCYLLIDYVFNMTDDYMYMNTFWLQCLFLIHKMYVLVHLKFDDTRQLLQKWFEEFEAKRISNRIRQLTSGTRNPKIGIALYIIHSKSNNKRLKFKHISNTR